MIRINWRNIITVPYAVVTVWSFRNRFKTASALMNQIITDAMYGVQNLEVKMFMKWKKPDKAFFLNELQVPAVVFVDKLGCTAQKFPFLSRNCKSGSTRR